MMKLPVIAALFLFTLNLYSQTPVGSWSDHLSYSTARSIAVGTKEVFVSTGSSVIIYNKEYSELKKMSTTSGLTETGISSIAWSEESSALVIGYTSTNVDFFLNNAIVNIPDILNKYIPGKKEINRIRTAGKYAYLACSFGVVVIDIIRKEIYDTWKPGPGTDNNEVLDICFGKGNIYAATETGVYFAPLSQQGLSYFGNWNLLNSLPDPWGKYNTVVYSGGKLYANKIDPMAAGDSIFVADQTAILFSYISGVFNYSMDQGTEGFTVSSGSSARYFGSDGTLRKTINTYPFAIPNIMQSVSDEGSIWIADINSGLVRGVNMTDFLMLNLPGPVSNKAFHISSFSGKTVICGGGTDNSWENLGIPFQVSIHKEKNWNHLTGNNVNDAIRSIIDPDDENHLFVSTWGGGLLEYMDNNLINRFTEANSPLQSIIPGKPYVRICGLAMDKDKNLWITQSGVPGSIKVLKKDGSWIANSLTIDAPVIGDLIITRSDYKWIILPEGHGLFILDDNKTPEVSGDDRYKRLVVKDTENQIASSVFSIAEDLDRNIWIGTEQGPLIYYNPDRVFNDDLRANRVKVPRNDGSGLSDYLLKSETVTSIAVDGANRKWLGTSGSGAYNVSPDGTTQLKTFNEQNSPILSDSIISISVDNKTGDVWFGTSRGVQSYRGNATAGGEKFTNVYAFPNPVREDFSGNVTITGLIKDTQINITDISGNLVFKTISDGGAATWDLKTYNGKHVATGVYLIFCASSDGSEAFVTKILVIR
ncbi:MAG: T9SS type A sorting domain-containing protein [Bacteroidales bacterium]|nr:T9SS type A sorting domain-containing protein [Bacteroidales bacterium]